jgi:enoyl-CoA hydratase/carnithine racemase
MIETGGEGALRTITLSRPEKANALTRAMLHEVEAAVARAVADEARVLVLTGAGRVFSAGADLGEMKDGLGTDPVWERVSASIAGFPGLTIAALNGTVAGGAMGMVLACDLRLAVPGTAIFYPVMRLGYLPQPSDPARLAALAGVSRAKLILMGGARISVEEALSWGLVDRIVPGDRLMDEAAALAADVLAAVPGHAVAIKRMVR